MKERDDIKRDVRGAGETVAVNREELSEIVSIAKSVRMCFLMCAPKFSAGSLGENIVAAAQKSGAIIENLEKSLVALAVSVLSVLCAFQSCSAAVPLKWTVETSRAAPVAFDEFAGATYELEASLQSYGKALSIAGEPRLFWQTNGMDSAWWSVAATATSNRLAATWTPDMDVGARSYNCFIGVTGSVYNAAFTLRLRPSPGAVPNLIDQPPRILDLSTTTVVNPPWPTDETIDARILAVIETNKITAITDTNAVRHIVTNTVTKSYVEGLGISGGGADAPNYLAVSNAAMSAASATNDFLRTSGGTVTGEGITIKGYESPDAIVYPHLYFKWASGSTGGTITLNAAGGLDLSSESDVHVHNLKIHGVSTDDSTYYLRNYGISDAYISGGTIHLGDMSINPLTFEEADDLFYPKAYGNALYNSVSSNETKMSQMSQSVSNLSTSVSAIGALLNAEDAHFVSTNYDSSTRLPEAYVEIKQNGSWLTIWREMTRWNKWTGDGFDWSAWSGFHPWKTNVESELSFKAEKNWGMYDSETGGLSPEGYTQISSSNILIAANMAYQRTVTSGGAVWVLQCNTGSATLGGDTNGFFRVLDSDGNTQFEIIKGDKREMGADASGITVDNSTSPPTVTIPYSVVAGEHPTIYVCDNLTAANWKGESDSACLANVSWSGSSGAYVATVQRKSAGSQLFVKATYMSGGETYINNVAPVGMSSIMLFGTKFYLGTNTISGKLVLTLSTTAPSN